MNKKLQQRIVGSIAVIALLILVLPHLFSSNVPTIPPRVDDKSNNTSTYNSNTQNNLPDDFDLAVISVAPIPTLDGLNSEASNINPQVTPPVIETPVNENIWNDITTQPTAPLVNNSNTDVASNYYNTNNTDTAPQDADTQLSVAEKLLAEAQSTNNITANNSVQLPKIELIGSTQANNTKTNPTPNIELIGSAQSNNTKNNATTSTTQNAPQPKFTWYIQVGSYASKENATKVMSDYRKKGYPSEAVFLSGQYKVRIGPLKTQNNARNVQTELKRNGINSYIIQIQ